MPLLRLDKAALHYGTLVLLDAVSLSISKGDKIGLLGRNGAGKTTLLSVLAEEIQLDAGERWLKPGTRIAWLKQSLPEADGKTVYATNCLACHGVTTKQRWPETLPPGGNMGPPLVAMKQRFPDKAKLRAQIWDATKANPHSVMPPFGKHQLLSETEIDYIVEWLHTI